MCIHNAEMLPPGELFDLSLVDYYPYEGITLLLVGVFIINQLGWLMVANEDQR